jgi:hypothetical protein
MADIWRLSAGAVLEHRHVAPVAFDLPELAVEYALMQAPQEVWRPVVGHESFYDVSNLGRVRSRWGAAPLVLRATRGPNGYVGVNLCDGRGRKRISVHTLVAAAFIGPRPHGHEVSHANGDRSDNAAENLCYESHQANCLRRAAHGTAFRPKGERHHNAKLDDAKVRAIFELHAAGRLQREIAAEVGVTQSNISRVLSGVQWSHLRP